MAEGGNEPQSPRIRIPFSFEEIWHLIRAYILYGKTGSQFLEKVKEKSGDFPVDAKQYYETATRDKIRRRLNSKFLRQRNQIQDFITYFLDKIEGAEKKRDEEADLQDEQRRTAQASQCIRGTTENTSPTHSPPLSNKEILLLVKTYRSTGPKWHDIAADMKGKLGKSSSSAKEWYEKCKETELQEKLLVEFDNLISKYKDADHVRAELRPLVTDESTETERLESDDSAVNSDDEGDLQDDSMTILQTQENCDADDPDEKLCRLVLAAVIKEIDWYSIMEKEIRTVLKKIKKGEIKEEDYLEPKDGSDVNPDEEVGRQEEPKATPRTGENRDADNCVKCGTGVGRRQQAVSCDTCSRWQHRTCDTGAGEDQTNSESGISRDK